MSMQNSLNSGLPLADGDASGQNVTHSHGNIPAEKQGATSMTATDAVNLLSLHKGKLAVGAAAMLGIAVFYHWRESKLAKHNEEEYARLQRLKAVLDVDKSK